MKTNILDCIKIIERLEINKMKKEKISHNVVGYRLWKRVFAADYYFY